MPWGAPLARRHPRFVCLSRETMETEGYLCLAESPSHGSGQQPDWASRFPPSPWETWGCHCPVEMVCRTNALQECGASVQVSPSPPEPRRDVVADACLIAWGLTAGASLFYVGYWLWRCFANVRSADIRKAKTIKAKLMKITVLSGPTADPIPPSLPADPENVAPPVVPARDAPSDSMEHDEKEEPAPIPPGDPAKVAWENFITAFRKRDAHGPFPPLETGSVITEEEADSFLEEEELGIKGLLADCRDRTRCRQIAQAFLAQFPEPASEWATASLLKTVDEDTTYWVAGDVHAKVSAIAKICAVIADRYGRGLTKNRNLLILLGDYVDRGDEPLETLAFIEHLKLRPLFDGFEVITLKGNHDVGLSRNEDGEYVSMVRPSETAEYLQACAMAGEDVSVEADAAMRLAAVSPRMCELTGIDLTDPSRTMLFVHGGVPHVDLQAKLYEVRNRVPQGEPFFEALAGEAIPEGLRKSCAEDFTWIRFAKDLPVKQPNRGSRGCEIGTEDVSQYLFLHRALTTRDITFIFRGHDHERPGFACYSPHPELNPTKKRFAQRECNVLTLNAMEPDHSSSGMFRERDLALAEWTIGAPVRLHRIKTHHLEVAKVVHVSPEGDVNPPPVQPEEALPPMVPPEGDVNPPPVQPDEALPPMVRPEDLMIPSISLVQAECENEEKMEA